MNPELVKKVEDLRNQINETPISGWSNVLELYTNFSKALAELAQENANDANKDKNIEICKEFLQVTKPLEEYDHLLNTIYVLNNKMLEAIPDEPHIMLEMLEFQHLVVERLTAGNPYSNLADNILKKIWEYRSKIE